MSHLNSVQKKGRNSEKPACYIQATEQVRRYQRFLHDFSDIINFCLEFKGCT